MRKRTTGIIAALLVLLSVVSLAVSSGAVMTKAAESTEVTSVEEQQDPEAVGQDAPDAETADTADQQEQVDQKREEIKKSYFPDTRLRTFGVAALAAEKTVHMERVRDIRYNGFITRYFTVNGNAAWCLEPAKFAPATGDYRARVIDNTSDLAKVMYYSTDAPGEKALWDWYGSQGFWQHADVWSGAAVASHDDRFVYSHMVLSWVYSNYDYDAAFFGTDLYGQSWFNEAKQDFLAKVDAVLALPDPPESFTAYVLDTGSTQVIGGWDYTPTGYARLRKSSADPTLTDGNDCYSLKGAKYGVYSDEACKKLVKELTTGEDGTSNTIDLSPGKYYVKEITAPKGYLKDEEVHAVTVKDSQTAEVRVADEPGNDPAAIEISKIDQETGELITQGAASLEGTQFTITHYGKLYTKEQIESGAADQDVAANGISKRSWVIQTKEVQFKDGSKHYVADLNIKGSFMEELSDEPYRVGSLISLPLGTLVMEETKAPEGYLLDGSYLTAVGSTEKITGKYVSQITKVGELAKLQGGNQYAMSDRVIRGGVKIQKRDLETKETAAQGGAALKGAEFSIISLNDGAVLVGGKQYEKNETVLKIRTGADGTAVTSADALPYGHYRIEESKAPEGYLKDGAEAVEFSITENEVIVDLTDEAHSVYNQIIRGGVKIQKRDLETGDVKAQGNATLKETEFAIISLNDRPVLVEGKLFQKNETVKKIQTGLDGTASTASDLLPYGRYRIEETKAPNGYLQDGAEAVEFSVTENGKIVALTDKEHSIYNQIKRGDLEGVKIGDGTHKRLEGIPFKITSKTSGESHVIVTDENGQFSTASEWVSHKQNTNAGKTSEDGIWFGTSEPDDSKGALPYDTYEIEEMSCKNNKGMKLIPVFEVVVRKDKVKIDLGTLTDDYEVRNPKLKTKAYVKDTGLKKSFALKNFVSCDEVEYEDIDAGEYVSKVTVMRESDESVYQVDGKDVTITQDVTLDGENPYTVDIAYDATGLSGDAAVYFHELYTKDGELVADHKEITSKSQTIRFYDPKLKTKAYVKDTGLQTGLAVKEFTSVDEVEYEDIPAGTYIAKVTAMRKSDGSVYQTDGNDVTVTQKVTLDGENPYTVELTYDATGLRGDAVVYFEELYTEDGELVGEHKNINSKSQTITFRDPKLKTKACVKGTSQQTSLAVKDFVSVDEVEYEDIPAGKYVAKVTVMRKSDGNVYQVDGEDVRFTEEVWLDGKLPYTVETKFDATGLRGDAMVYFEELYTEDGELVGEHKDIESEEQTITFVEGVLKTRAYVKDTGKQEAEAVKDFESVDEVEYEGIPAGEYVAKVTAMRKSDGSVYQVDGKDVTVTKEVTLDGETPYTVDLKYDATGLRGDAVVYFEELYTKDGDIVGEHKDINSEEQTITFPAETVQTGIYRNGPLLFAAALGLFFAAAFFWFRGRKREVRNGKI